MDTMLLLAPTMYDGDRWCVANRDVVDALAANQVRTRVVTQARQLHGYDDAGLFLLVSGDPRTTLPVGVLEHAQVLAACGSRWVVPTYDGHLTAVAGPA